MEKQYCVFWIPTTIHGEIAPILPENIQRELDNAPKDQPFEYTVDDHIDDGVGKHYITATINLNDEGNKNIIITSEPDDGNRCKDKKCRTTLELVFEQSSQNGLIEYSFRVPRRSSNKAEDTAGERDESVYIIKALPYAVYHLIKKFFHYHEFHGPECDSTLEAYIGKEKIDIKAFDNEALMFYFKQFEQKFIGYKNLIRELLQETERLTKRGSEYIIWYIEEEYVRIETLCVIALGQSIYYNSLFHSWYNISCRYSNTNAVRNCENCVRCTKGVSHGDQTRCKELHRVAINTKNAVDCIVLLQGKNRDLLSYHNAFNTTRRIDYILSELKISNVLAFIFGVFTVLSLVWAICTHCTNRVPEKLDHIDTLIQGGHKRNDRNAVLQGGKLDSAIFRNNGRMDSLFRNVEYKIDSASGQIIRTISSDKSQSASK